MWYAIVYKTEAEAQSAVTVLTERKLIGDFHPVAFPFAPEVFYPTVVFPEEFRDETLKALSLSDGPTTATSEPQLRLILTEPVTVLLPSGDLAEATQSVLRTYAPELGMHILATNPHSRMSLPLEEPGVFHLRFYSSPAKSEKPQPFPQLFRRAIPAGMSDGLPPSGMGTPLLTPEGVVAAEVHGNTLYVLFDLPHAAANNEELACYLLAQIMELLLDVREAQRRGDGSPEQGYVKAFHRRRRLQLVKLQGQRLSLEKRIKEARQTIESCRRDLKGVTKMLEGYDGQTEELARQEYRDLLKLPHVVRVEISGGYLHVHTDEIYLQQDGQTYLLGSYILKIPMFGRGPLAVINKTPKRCDSACYHHPHISGDGTSMCLGNWAPIIQLIAEQQWSLVTQLMIEFLHHCNTEVGNYLKVLQGYWKPLKEPRSCSCQIDSVKAKGGMKP